MGLSSIGVVFMFIVITSSRYSEKKGEICGKNNGALPEEGRIVGGYDVGYYKYPWFVALERDGVVSCGGALIGPRTVLTAAHCFKEVLTLASHGDFKLEDYYTVKLGVYNNCVEEKTQRVFKVEKVQVHELFVKKDPYYDICLITLANTTKDFSPICLPATTVKKRPHEGTVPGLGRLVYNGTTPCTLHEARLLIYPDDDCTKMIQSSGNNPKDLVNAFCAGYLSGGIDTCQGDSGGPLQIMDKNGHMIILGIVSYGFDCAVEGFLGVYTDVSRYLDWIEEKSGLDSSVVNQIYTHSTPKPSNTTTNGDQMQQDLSELQNLNKPNLRPPYFYPRPFRRPFIRPINIIIINNRRNRNLNSRRDQIKRRSKYYHSYRPKFRNYTITDIHND